MEELQVSLAQHNEQLCMVNAALQEASDSLRESLLVLQSDLHQLIQLTQKSLDTLNAMETSVTVPEPPNEKTELDDEYLLFMKEMSASGAYEEDNSQEQPGSSKGATTSKESLDNIDIETEMSESGADEEDNSQEQPGSSKGATTSKESLDDVDIEEDLATLRGMKCAVYHMHKWGGQPSLHNAMVSSIFPRQHEVRFNDLQVRVLFTHPTHTEMLPCPFYFDGECRFDDDQCRYSHGLIVKLSNLKDAIEPDFEGIKVGSRVLLKLNPPDGEDTSLTKKASERYHLWHRALVKSVDQEKRTCVVTLESGVKQGELHVNFEEMFPLTVDDTDSDDSLSDTEYPESKLTRLDHNVKALLLEKSLDNNGPAIGEWERHTRGIGSKLMLAMGYVPGMGLGAAGEGRVQPVEARPAPRGRSLDHCMAMSESLAAQDPLKVQQKLRRLQKKEEERNKRAYEREQEKERRNVFNFINKTLGDQSKQGEAAAPAVDIKQSSSKDLNIEYFKITEDTKKIERDISKLNSSLCRHSVGSDGYKRINDQINEKNAELSILKKKEQQITKEQNHRKDKRKMTVF